MEWRGQSTVSSAAAFSEAQRWVEVVTGKSFGSSSFRSALENGVLLCDLINKLKPGIIKRVNRLSTPIAGLDNVNVFLKACRKLGLNEAQLFHPGDLQDVSSRVTVRREETNRRLKNVLITLYWLGRKSQADPFYPGPVLNLKAFEGLLGIALSKVLEDSCPRWSVRDSGYSESWYPDKEELLALQQASYRREDSVESLDSVGSRTLSVTSDNTLRAGSEGCGSDAEAEQGFRMSDTREMRARGYMPTPLRRKRCEQHEEDNRTSPLIRSKSLSDIPLGSLPLATPHLYRSSLTFDISAEAAAAGQMRQEHLRRIQGRIKETEAKWQEDLTRWKDRRRSANSDLHKKREEREPSGAYGGEAESSEQEAHGNSVSAATCHSSYTHTLAHTPHQQQQQQQQQHQADPDPTPRSRALLSRALAVDLPRTETTSRGRLPPSQPAAQGESLPLGSLPSDLACTPTTLSSSAAMPGLTGSSGGAPSRMPTGTPPYQVTGAPHNSNSTPPPPLGPVPNAMKVHWNSPVSSSLTGTPVARAAGPQYPSSGADPDPLEELRGAAPFYRPGTPAVKPLGGGGARVSATLPRGFRRSEASSCLSAGVTPRPFGVTPRPFGAKPSRVSLSKLYAKDDSHKSLMSDPKERSLFTSLPAPYGKVATFADLEQPLAPPLQSSPKQERRQGEEEGPRGGRTSAPVNLSSSAVSKSTASLPDYSSGPQTAETEVLHSDMRVSLNQRPNSATDFGFQTHWDSTGARITSVQPGTPAELSHLRVGDEILSVTGHSVAHMSYNQWKGSMADALAKGTLFMDLRRHGHTGRPEHYVNVSKELGASATSAGKPLTNGVALNGVGPSQMNGGLHDDAVALKNKGGSESAISDLQVPSISASSSRWSWDPEEERKKHETWQREQERLLQEKYQRDQQRLDDEWRRAQQEVGGDGGNHGDGLRGAEEHRAFEMANGGTPLAFSSQSASSTFVSSNQYVEEEGPVKTREEPVQSAEGSSSKEAGLDVCEGSRTNQWPDGAYVFATLADADRTKSKSTPTLDSIHRQELRGPVGEWPEEKKLGQQMSQGEFERQQILDEMKKRTPLHRDSSWIRQRSSSSSSFAKEPVALGNDPVRRVESLDDLHSSSAYTWPSSAAPNPMRPHSALGTCGGYRGPGRYSMGPPGGGSGGGSSTLPASLSASCLRQGPWARAATPSPTPLMEEASRSPPRMSRPLSGRRMCTRCERPLAKGAAMVIESLGLCFHLACFKCVSCRSELRRPGPGSQVRIRNRQLFCDSCYERVRTRPLPK